MTNHAELCNYEKKPLEFVNLLIENARAFVNFSTGKDTHGNPNVYVQNINRLGGSVFRQHIIPLLTARNFDKEMFDYLARNIETYLYYFLITKEQAKALEKNFAEWNIHLAKVTTLKELNDFVAKTLKVEVDSKEIEYRVSLNLTSRFSVSAICSPASVSMSTLPAPAFTPRRCSTHITTPRLNTFFRLPPHQMRQRPVLKTMTVSNPCLAI